MSEMLFAPGSGYLDNQPNMLQVASYQAYRYSCDKVSGLSRAGVRDPELYAVITSNASTEFGMVDGLYVPLIAPQNPFHVIEAPPLEGQGVDRYSLWPRSILPERSRLGLVGLEQVWLDPASVQDIITPPPDARLRPQNVDALLAGKFQGELIGGHGETQFTIISHYDMRNCQELRAVVPQDVMTRGGHTLTVNKEKIIAHLPALKELHETVFARQAVQIGYYDGLVGDMIARLMDREDFTGAAAFDKDTGKPFMFAIFATGREGLDELPWINKPLAEAMIRAEASFRRSALALPLVITAKFNGLGVFDETASLALHDILYRTQCEELFMLYNANLQSVRYTPRIINKAVTSHSALLQSTAIELAAITRQ